MPVAAVGFQHDALGLFFETGLLQVVGIGEELSLMPIY